jgi:hypothetical protein
MRAEFLLGVAIVAVLIGLVISTGCGGVSALVAGMNGDHVAAHAPAPGPAPQWITTAVSYVPVPVRSFCAWATSPITNAVAEQRMQQWYGTAG